MLGETMDNFGWTLSADDENHLHYEIQLFSDWKATPEDEDAIIKLIKKELALAQKEHRYKGEVRCNNDMPPSIELKYRCIFEYLKYEPERIEEIISKFRKSYRKVDHAIPFVMLFVFAYALLPTFLWFGSDCCWNVQGMLLWWVILPGPFVIFYLKSQYTWVNMENTEWYDCDTGKLVRKDK